MGLRHKRPLARSIQIQMCQTLSGKFINIFLFSSLTANFEIVQPFPQNIYAIEFSEAEVTCIAFDPSGGKVPEKIKFMRRDDFYNFHELTANNNLYFTNRTEQSGRYMTSGSIVFCHHHYQHHHYHHHHHHHHYHHHYYFVPLFLLIFAHRHHKLTTTTTTTTTITTTTFNNNNNNNNNDNNNNNLLRDFHKYKMTTCFELKIDHLILISYVKFLHSLKM